MKRLLILIAPIMAISAYAQHDVQIVGKIKAIDLNPNVVITVNTDGGERQVYLGQPEDWRGTANFLNRRDTISVSGRTDPSNSWIIADRMWINGSHVAIPRSASMRTTGATNTAVVGVRTALTPTRGLVNEVLGGWMSRPRSTANDMIAKYGVPDEVTNHRMVWHNNGPWKLTVLTNEEIPHNFPMAHHDMLLQVIDYKVPVTRFNDLASFDGSVVVDRTKGEIGARCDNEAANFLAINLANDVATGAKTSAEARQFYADAMRAKTAGNLTNQQRDYTSRFVFSTPRTGTADPDGRHGG